MEVCYNYYRREVMILANIQPKKKPAIQKGNGYAYNPLTFYSEHHVENFYEVEDPQFILDNLKTFEFFGEKYIFFDTEDHAHYKNSNEIPKHVVRRWVGTGKTAVPVDLPFSMQFCDGVNCYCIYDNVENNFEKFKKLASLFLDPSIITVIHNAKFDMHMMHNIGMKIVGKIIDTVVLSKIANENRTSFALVDLAARAHGIVKFEGMVDAYKQINHVTDYRQIPRELLTEYGCADVWNLFCVFVKEYTSMIEQDKDSKPGQRLQDVFNNEMECMIVLYAMERRGMKADKSYEKPLKESLQKTLDKAEAEVYELAGGFFNINSGKQVLDVMLKQGVDSTILKYTDKGNVCLDKDEMTRLDEIYNIPIIKKIQAYKKADKLLNTYAVGIYSQNDAENHTHGSMNQTEATTGRMSITKPALQTLPKKDKRIRRIYIPESDEYEMWFMDLDQVEYRGFAHYARATSLIEAINNGYDVHAATAATIHNIPVEQVSDGIHNYAVYDTEKKQVMDALEAARDSGDDIQCFTVRVGELEVVLLDLQKYVDMRASAKTVNFALVYGMGNDALAEDLRLSLSEAVAFRARYFAQIPEARPFINTVHNVIKTKGYVTNFYGRRRRLGPNDCYKAPNSLIQGWAADYIKHKMVDTYKYIMYNCLKTFLVNIVHDELIEMVHKTEKEHLPTLRWLLSDFENYRCKITAGIEYGDPSWGQKKEPLEDIGFKAPEDFSYKSYNVFDGHVFDINLKEVS